MFGGAFGKHVTFRFDWFILYRLRTGLGINEIDCVIVGSWGMQFFYYDCASTRGNFVMRLLMHGFKASELYQAQKLRVYYKFFLTGVKN